jgi:hypothetical protein
MKGSRDAPRREPRNSDEWARRTFAERDQFLLQHRAAVLIAWQLYARRHEAMRLAIPPAWLLVAETLSTL